MLPPQVKQLIHNLFVIMWATGCTPDKWKHSNTRLIHKKGNAMDSGNYRPIALANTMYKISPANVVGTAHWYSDTLTVRGRVPWGHTMVRIPAGAKL